MKRTIGFMEDMIHDNGGTLYFNDKTMLKLENGKYRMFVGDDSEGVKIPVEQAFRKFDANFDKIIYVEESYKEG